MSYILNSIREGYDKRVRPNYGGNGYSFDFPRWTFLRKFIMTLYEAHNLMILISRNANNSLLMLEKAKFPRTNRS